MPSSCAVADQPAAVGLPCPLSVVSYPLCMRLRSRILSRLHLRRFGVLLDVQVRDLLACLE